MEKHLKASDSKNLRDWGNQLSHILWEEGMCVCIRAYVCMYTCIRVCIRACVCGVCTVDACAFCKMGKNVHCQNPS